MQYQILGPLRVVDRQRYASISARKIEVVLATLLVRAGQVVGVDKLINEIWGDSPPRQAHPALHVYISQLRKFLHRTGVAGSPIETRSPGYALRLGADTLDVQSFQRLMRRGRELAQKGDRSQAAVVLELALSHWRGPALGDRCGRGPILSGFSAWAEEARLECVELHIDAQLSLGQHRELVGRGFNLITDHPLRETFYCQLMLALYRSERQGDALEVYQMARRTLDAELGVEPCRRLRGLYHAILVGDARLDLAPVAQARAIA